MNMCTMRPKSEMTEEDIKFQYINPAIESKWDRNKISMETRITDGMINLRGNRVSRSEAKKADYILYINPQKPIAIIEAKSNKYSVSRGLQQAMQYAEMLDVPFAYSSNGDGFYEHDYLTGKERELSLEEFPSEEELLIRFTADSNDGKGLSDDVRRIINQPYYSSQNTYPPRYYQRVAINRAVEEIAQGKDRLLLVMATGTEKHIQHSKSFIDCFKVE